MACGRERRVRGGVGRVGRGCVEGEERKGVDFTMALKQAREGGNEGVLGGVNWRVREAGREGDDFAETRRRVREEDGVCGKKRRDGRGTGKMFLRRWRKRGALERERGRGKPTSTTTPLPLPLLTHSLTHETLTTRHTRSRTHKHAHARTRARTVHGPGGAGP